MNSILRKILRPFKPVAKKLFPGYFEYDTVDYWVKREGPTYYNNYSVNFDTTELARLQQENILSELKKLQFDSVFEYGCGYCRILKLVEDEFKGKVIEGCDISPHQLKNAEHLLGPDTTCNIFLVDGKTVPRKDKSFDVVYVCNVLQHQTHKMIDSVRSEIFRLAKKYIILMEPNHTTEEETADRLEGTDIDKTCYRHNHTGYFEKRGCKILKCEWIKEIGNYIIVIEMPKA